MRAYEELDEGEGHQRAKQHVEAEEEQCGQARGTVHGGFVQARRRSCESRASGSSRSAGPSALGRSAQNGVRRRWSAGSGKTSSAGTRVRRQLPTIGKGCASRGG